MDGDRVGRLETFLTQAKQEERLRIAKLPPGLQPAELVSLAVTGWLVGNTAAETKPAVAIKMWLAREFVMKYQRTADPTDRKKLLEAWQGDKVNAIAVDELAQLIANLPPPEPEKIEGGVMELKTGGRKNGHGYLVQLPQEYRHSRSYPVLIVCHSTTETPKDTLDRWANLAWEHGYILVSPEWGKGVHTAYGWTSQEQQPVLEVLRDVKQRFNVDSDRVFLAGHGPGAEMCYDVGLAHPDLFAGVLPMSGTPAQITHKYRRNAQFLPFYVVSGDRSESVYRENYYLFKDWILQMYPVIYATYKGRGAEVFGEELRPSFDWMRNRRRIYPLKQLGRYDVGHSGLGSEFVSYRQCDNRFYWLSTDVIEPAQTVEGPKVGRRQGAMLQAEIQENNRILVHTAGVKQVTVWLGRDRAGQNMVDLTRPVEVHVNGAQRFKKMVTPSIAIMLDDLLERGDRQRLFYARLDFNQ
jgi:predicted esterase